MKKYYVGYILDLEDVFIFENGYIRFLKNETKKTNFNQKFAIDNLKGYQSILDSNYAQLKEITKEEAYLISSKYSESFLIYE